MNLPFNFPMDKAKHIVVGLIVAAIIMLLMAVEKSAFDAWYIAHPGFFAIINAGLVVHAAKEAEDRLDNLIMYHEGRPPMHGVKFLDFLSGMFGTTLFALVFLWAGIV